ncbi:MAG: GNAT family N-acetyltransferase [Firmicutes bacterium]|nr:GNAT family N-acetyltransferase [Bacillota bacterium]
MRYDLYEMFRKNFPFIIRENNTALNLLSDPNNKVIEKKDEKGELIGVSVINKNTIYMLCVNEQYRNKGIGTQLLNESENYILSKGYDTVILGVGDSYLMPGIPMRSKPYNEVLNDDKIYDNVSDEANKFFTKNGYTHSWEECNCFDMRSDYSKVDFPNWSIGDTIDGIQYRWATKEDIPSIIECTDDAHQKFSKYYKDESIYSFDGEKRVLIALDKNEVCGTLMVCTDEAKEKGIGSVGCTTVKTDHQGRHIGVNMVILGNKVLKDEGIKEGYLGYTYSGLDKMYGYAGYKICIYYNMAQKQLVLEKNYK